MRIQLLQPVTLGSSTYPSGATLEVVEPTARQLIINGQAIEADPFQLCVTNAELYAGCAPASMVSSRKVKKQKTEE